MLSTQHLLLPMEEVQSCWTTVQLRVPLYLLCLFICLFVSKVIYRFWILFTLQVVLLSMLDIACCSFGSPWKYGGLLQK